MNKQNFLLSLNALAENFSLPISKGYIELMVNMLKLTDDQITKAMEHFMNEQTMSKLPSIAQWKNAAGFDTRSPVTVAEEKFIDKVSNYLTSYFVSSQERRKFSDSLSDLERQVLSEMGGISELWLSVNNEKYSRPLAKVLNELRTLFRDRATEENISIISLAFSEKEIHNITNNTLKKLN